VFQLYQQVAGNQAYDFSGVGNRTCTKPEELPPINPTPRPHLRVLWIHTLLYPGSCGRW
jgi:hypothetical protein